MVRRRPTAKKAYSYGGGKAIKIAIRQIKADITLLENLEKATTALEKSKNGTIISMVTISTIVFCSALSRSLPSIIDRHRKDLRKLERSLK